MIQLPKTLSRNSYDDLEDWIGLMLRSAKRSIVGNNQAQEKLKTNDDGIDSD